jgi:outer membrane protein assembly factor BamA
LYSYQRRPDYTRTSGKLSFGVQFNESRSNTIGIFPLEINVIKIPQKSAAFEDYLIQANDPVLSDSYTDHLIIGCRGSYVMSPPEVLRRNTFFTRVNLEWAGYPPVKWVAQETQDTSGNSFYTVAGVRYAEFVKADCDMRWHRTVNDKSSFAFRTAAGVGVPYGNLTVLPFESSFFVGGANGLRAWRARSIGPGTYSAPLLAYDRTGEIKVEGNAEYRFKLIGFLEGAFFADVGNIWNIHDDPNKPGGRISSKFLSELAVGTGVGARLNFDFFVVRFDLGLQTKDPSLPAGERWLFQPKDQFEATTSEQLGAPFTYTPQLNFNLGIGYPF